MGPKFFVQRKMQQLPTLIDMTHTNENGVTWDKVIEPKKYLFDLRLKRSLAVQGSPVTFCKKRFCILLQADGGRTTLVFYTAACLQPLSFSLCSEISPGISHRPALATECLNYLFYLSGITCWNYFARLPYKNKHCIQG
jgi:hypothetical protein